MAELAECALRKIDEELIQYVTRTIVERFHPKKILLFGSELEPDCALLMPYAAASRYPDVGPEPDAAVGNQLIAAAERIRDGIRQRLPGAQP